MPPLLCHPTCVKGDTTQLQHLFPIEISVIGRYIFLQRLVTREVSKSSLDHSFACVKRCIEVLTIESVGAIVL